MKSDFMIVYQPNPALNYPKRRFLISSKRLAHYVGEKNANSLLLKADQLRTDKLRCKLRKFGIIDFYLK